MLTRLKVTGFKNLLDVDISFGPFTCIAGGNAVGKSNLFDAIVFLSALTDRPLLQAAMGVRDQGGRASDIRNLFHSSAAGYGERMRFEAEMIIPAEGVDDLGQPVKASITFLRYSVELLYKPNGTHARLPTIQLAHESLEHINVGAATSHLPFPHRPVWRKCLVFGRRVGPFISTDGDRIRLHQEGNVGRARPLEAASLPRTVLSTANAWESPTAVLVRREMQSWRLLQLEPTALRSPDPVTAPTHVASDGSHLPATLYSLARKDSRSASADVYAQISNRLADLIDDVLDVQVDHDDTRGLLTLNVLGTDRAAHPARSLSDGTLRFLALAVLEADRDANGVLCLEEPENGIHPERIVAMIGLLQDLAVDPMEEVGGANPLRQVIINTHSPTVVAEVPEDSLLFAERSSALRGSDRVSTVVFRPLSGTWRAKAERSPQPIQKGRILSFLNPVRVDTARPDHGGADSVRVVERDDIQEHLGSSIKAGAMSDG